LPIGFRIWVSTHLATYPANRSMAVFMTRMFMEFGEGLYLTALGTALAFHSVTSASESALSMGAAGADGARFSARRPSPANIIAQNWGIVQMEEGCL